MSRPNHQPSRNTPLEDGEVTSENEDTHSYYDSSEPQRTTRREERRKDKQRRNERRKKQKQKDKQSWRDRERSQEKEDYDYRNRREDRDFRNRQEASCKEKQKYSQKRERDHKREREERDHRGDRDKEEQNRSAPKQDTPVNPKDTIYTYVIDNKTQIKRVSEAHLHQRVKAVLIQLQANLNALKNPVTIPQNTSPSNPSEEEEEDHSNYRQRRQRYFSSSTAEGEKREVKCYRCGGRGHISQTCLQPHKESCVYCLKEHRSGNCELTCFRCGCPGHISTDCKVEGRSCSKCRKYGHETMECGSVLLGGKRTDPEDFFSPEELQFQADISALRCLKDCKVQGHYNCHSYGPEAHSYIYDYEQ